MCKTPHRELSTGYKAPPGPGRAFPAPANLPRLFFVSRCRRSMDKLHGSHSPASPPPPPRCPPPSSSFISFYVPLFFVSPWQWRGPGAEKGTCSNFKGEEASAWEGGGTRRSPGSLLSAPRRSKPAAGPRFTAKGARSRAAVGPSGTSSTGSGGKEQNEGQPPPKSTSFLLIREQRCSLMSSLRATALSPDAFIAQGEPPPCEAESNPF